MSDFHRPAVEQDPSAAPAEPGVPEQSPGTTAPPGSALRDRLPGLVVAVAVALVATATGTLVPIVGGPVFGIVLGVLVASVLSRVGGGRVSRRLCPGLETAAKPVLQSSIVLLGATLSLRQVAEVGASSLPVMLGTLAVALAGAYLLGRLLGVRGDAGLLIGIGTAICGASAIAATQAVLKARESQVAYAIGTIFTFNIVAVLTFPQFGHLLGLDPHAFGLWAGTAINDTSSVVAAGYSYGGDAGPYSVVVKLTRSLMLIPIVLVLGVWVARRGGRSGGGAESPGQRVPWTKIVPPFLVGFIAASALVSAGVIPSSWHEALTTVGTFLITTALAGIGLGMRMSDIRQAGPRPLALGAGLWVLVGASSIGLQALTGTL